MIRRKCQVDMADPIWQIKKNCPVHFLQGSLLKAPLTQYPRMNSLNIYTNTNYFILKIKRIQVKLCRTATLGTEETIVERSKCGLSAKKVAVVTEVAVVGRWYTGKAIFAGLCGVKNEGSSAKTRRAESVSFFFSR